MKKMVSYLRQALPYIHEHRNKTIIVLLRGSIVSNLSIPSLIQDWALLQNLNIRLIIIPWLEAVQPKDKVETTQYQKINQHTTELWSEINKYCIQHQTFISSGTFTTARPQGIINGIDCEHRGLIKNLHTDQLNRLLNTEQHIWLPPLSFSSRGKPLLLHAPDFAQYVSNALNIKKLFIIADQNELPELFERQQHVSHLTPSHHPFFQFAHDATAGDQALKRIYLIDAQVDGAMLLELYTRDGCGLLLYSDHYDLIRQATLDDIADIQKITETYSNQNILIERSTENIVHHIDQYHIILRDTKAIGCCRISEWDENSLEIASLAIANNAKGLKLGERLLQHIEKHAKQNNKKRLFALSTQTIDWFLDQGFVLSDVKTIPQSKQTAYDIKRQSKILCKLLK